MKKNQKTTTSPAPAIPSVPAPKAALKTVTAAPKTFGRAPKIIPPTAASAPVPAKPLAPPAALASPAPVGGAATVVNARVDVGFGNTLYLRGDGPGLSWNKGVPLTCVNSDHWQITLGPSTKPIVFKFLINDEIWSCGEDYTVEVGSAENLKPSF